MGAKRSYSGLRAGLFIVYLLVVGLNLQALWFAVRKVASLVGVGSAPTHMEWIESLMSCIAPVIAAALLPGVRVTVGCAEGKQWPYGGTVGAVKAYGGVHEETGADGVCVDASRKVVTSCVYMLAGAPHEIYESVGRMVEETLGLC